MRLNKVVFALLLALIVHGFTLAQDREITGVVRDANGLELFGVAVIIKGEHAKGTQTDMDGHYRIWVAPGKTLEFSYLGMKTQTVKVGSSRQIDITLQEEAEQIEEVEVVGYVTVKKNQYVGTAATVDKEALKRKSVSNVSKAIAGEVAGVRVINTSGQPGTGATIRVRGFGSVNGNRGPLYVVDGVAYEGYVNTINPDDIESMVVLKDATSTSVYGSRGANGVILITTKKGRADVSRIQVESKIGFNMRLLPRYDVIRNPERYIETAWSALRQSGALLQAENATAFAGEGYTSAIDYANKNIFSNLGINEKYNMWNVAGANLINPSTGKVNDGVTRKYDPEDWGDYAFQTAVRSEYNVSMSGGSGKTTYYTGFGYLKDEGYALNTGFERYTGRLNLGYQPKNWLKGEFNMGYTHTETKANGQGSSSNNLFWFTDNIPAIYPLFLRDVNGNKIAENNYGGYQYDFGQGRGFGALTNAIAQATYDKINRTNNDVVANLLLRAEITKGLTFETRLGGQYYNFGTNNYTNPYYGRAASENGNLSKFRYEQLNYTFLQMLRYMRQFGKHNLQAFVAHESTTYDYYTLGGSKSGLVDPKGTELQNAIKLNTLTSYIYNYRLESYFSQLLYDYEGKYLFSGTIRRDGTSRFLKNKWGNFASVGLGWVVSSENFLKEKEWLPYFKLKTSYGTVGDQSIGSGNDGYYPGYDVYDLGNFMGLPSAVFNRIGYPDLTWEKARIFQVGAEFTFLKSRAIDLQVDYYHKTTDNLIFDSRLAPSTGNGIWKVNDGKLINKGVEFNLQAHLVNTKNWRVDVGVNGEMLTNKLTKMPYDKSIQGEKILDISGVYGRSKNHSLFDIYTREYRGVNSQTGAAQWTVHYVDNNNDNVFNAGDTPILSLQEYQAKNPNAVIKEGVTESYSQATLKYIGKSAIPDIRGAFTLNAGYKGFSLSAQLLYSLGGYAYDGAYANLMNNEKIGSTTWHKDIENRWRQPGDVTDIPRLSSNYGNDADFNKISSRFLTKSDYLALNNVTLAYSLDKKVCQTIGFEGLTFTLAGDNLWLSTARKGFNPTTSESGNSSVYTYSPLSTFTLGVKATF